MHLKVDEEGLITLRETRDDNGGEHVEFEVRDNYQSYETAYGYLTPLEALKAARFLVEASKRMVQDLGNDYFSESELEEINYLLAEFPGLFV